LKNDDAFKRENKEVKTQTRNLGHKYFPTSSEWSKSESGSGEEDSFHLHFHCEVGVHV
jgi:hypothetical protein